MLLLPRKEIIGMLSVVVPVYNEEESLKPFFEVLKKELAILKMAHEIILWMMDLLIPH